MEYISHEDFKGFMNKLQANTTKGKLIKEGSNFDNEGEEHSLAVEKELEDLFKAGKIDQQTLNNALDYVADNDYKLYADNLGADYVLKNLEEGNAFTAGLAKAKKGEKFKVDGKTVKDTSNYDASMDEASYTDNYPGSWGYREGKDVEEGKNFTDPDESYFTMAVADQLNDEAWGLTPQQMDAAEAYLEKYYYELQGDFANNHEVGGGSTRAAKYIVDLIKKQSDVGEGLNTPPLQATGQTISTVEEEYTEDKPFKIPSRRNSAELDYDPQASRFEPDYMKTPGEDDDDDEDNIGIDDEDDLMNLPNIPKGLKQTVAKDKARYPFLREDQAPYGFSVLSPDERKQLKEYIESVKTIKKEIAKLTAKAGKKVKNEGGDMTGLTMTPSITSEGVSHEEIEKIESKIPEKLYTAAERVIEELRKAGLNDGEIKMFLDHEIEEKGKEAVMAQHDF